MGKEIIAQEGLAITMFDFPSFYMPIIISSRFRIEPEIGLYRFSESDEYWKQSATIFTLGCGFFSMTRKEKVDIYYGVRLKLARISWSEEYEYSWNGYQESEKDKFSKTDFYISPAVGGEYFFNKHFSLGGEIQLNYIILGQWHMDEYENDDSSGSEIKSNTLIFVRWYF